MPVFRVHSPASDADVQDIEQLIQRSLPDDLRFWLTAAGFGDIDDTLSFRKAWFAPIKDGKLQGGFLFAQDELGNFYGCTPDAMVVFFARSEPANAVIAPSFAVFLEELERLD